MSMIHTAMVRCGACGEETEARWAASVNADRRPDLRDAILSGSFQSLTCPNCETAVRLPAHLTYLDHGRGDWLLVEDIDQLGTWAETETEALSVFRETFGPGASAAAQELAEGVSPRVVFGWAALREKLLCTEHGVDDVTLELVKLATMRSGMDTPVGSGVALRLSAVDDDTLTLDAVDEKTERVDASASVPRSLLDDVADEPAAWAALREQLVTGPFVDINRMVVG